MLKKLYDRFEGKTSFWQHFILVIILSLLMVLFNYLFYINELIAYVQYIKFNSTPEFIKKGYELITQNHRFLYQISFFIIDFIWAPLLILLAYRVLKTYALFKSKYVRIIFIIIASFALASDFIENIWYLFLEPTYVLKCIVGVKISLYAISLFIFLYLLIAPIINKLLKFIWYSRISLLFIAIIIGLITQVEMGGDIVIRLFYDPYSFFFTLILVVTIAIPTSHYPEYFKIKDEGDESPYIFSIHQNTGTSFSFWHKILDFSPFRIIYYKRKANYTPAKKRLRDSFHFGIFRRSTGILLFIAFIYIVLNSYQVYLNPKFPTTSITFILFLLLVLFLSYISNLKIKAAEVLAGNDFTKNNIVRINRFKNIVISFYPLLILSTIAIIYCTVVVSKYNWTELSFVFTIVTLVILAITFIVFSVSRSWFKYVFYTDAKILRSEDQDNASNYIDATYKAYISPAPKSMLFLNKLYWFSDNIKYLRGFAILGFISVSFFIYLNFNWLFNHKVNFITVLFVIYMAYYGLFIIYIKHRMFVKQQADINFRYRYFWKNIVPFLLVILTIIAVYSVVKGNDLHYIQSIDRNQEEEIKLETLDNIIKDNADSLKKKHLFVSSYGGGLKSNLWTILVLDALERSNPTFLDNVRCFSGVSGGGVGFANYTLLSKDSIKREKQIDSIANFNYITLDLTFLTGRDLLREYIPDSLFKFKGKDRAYYGMKQHLKAITQTTDGLDTTTFFTEYFNAYKNRGYFPPLIINTVSTNGIQGVAFSIPIDNDDKFDSIFPGAINILNADPTTTSLHYLGAVSPTNRFPILSPSAAIEGKGHFIDGGAFDNSGILSSDNLINYYRKKDSSFNKKDSLIHYINISVSKDAFIKKFIKHHKITTKEISASGELPAIIGTASATQGVPAYITQKSKIYENFHQIILPHIFTYNDLKSTLGGEPYSQKLKNSFEILKAIKNSNQVIEELIENNSTGYLKDQVVQPATGRLMSRPSINFQKIMLKHPSVKEQFNTILKVLK